MPKFNSNSNSNYLGKEMENENVTSKDSPSGSSTSAQTNKVSSKRRKSSIAKAKRKEYRKCRPQGLDNFNHPDWYMPNSEIGQQIASVPFNKPAGSELRIQGCSDKNSYDHSYIIKSECTSRLQSVMAIDYFATPGVSTDGISGINMAAAKIYAAIRSKNSGAKVYEAADVMMYILEMQDIYANLCMLFRILGSCNYFQTLDKNVPDTFGSAMRIEMSDVRANRAKYFAQVNTLIEKVNSFAVPANLKVFKRSAYINTNIFRDSNSKHGQYYVFNKVNYYRWSAKTDIKGTELLCYTFNTAGPQSLQGLIDTISQQVDTLFLDSDVLTISADILKAFDTVSLYKFKPLAIDFAIEPAYDEYILSQIHNMRWINLDMDNITEANYNIKQEGQLIKYQPKFSSGTTSDISTVFPVYLTDAVFDSHSDDPNYEDVLEGTRLMYSGTLSSDGKQFTITSCGSELVINVSLHYRGTNGAVYNDTNIPMVVFRFTGQNIANFPDSNATEFTRMNKLNQFRSAPLRYQIISTGNSTGQVAEWAGFDIIGDTHWTTNIQNDVVKGINDVVMYAMYILE